jgi:hypothetical protein
LDVHKNERLGLERDDTLAIKEKHRHLDTVLEKKTRGI